MKISEYLFIALALSLIAGLPYKAYSLEHIPFYVTNNSAEDIGICCLGPWVRTTCPSASETCIISAGAVDDNFYYADVDIFSPYGTWKCCLSNLVSNCSGQVESSTPTTCTGEVFTLEKGDTAVYLTATTDSLTINLDNDSDASTAQARLAEESGTSSTTQATLGDDNNKPKRDRDTWSIQGTEGDTITVTLEADPASGHSGEQATLKMSAKSGQDLRPLPLIGEALPIEITTTLPETGEYQLVVQQHDIPEEVRFRGRYFLSVKSSSGNVQDIKPSEDVEH